MLPSLRGLLPHDEVALADDGVVKLTTPPLETGTPDDADKGALPQGEATRGLAAAPGGV